MVSLIALLSATELGAVAGAIATKAVHMSSNKKILVQGYNPEPFKVKIPFSSNIVKVIEHVGGKPSTTAKLKSKATVRFFETVSNNRDVFESLLSFSYNESQKDDKVRVKLIV